MNRIKLLLVVGLALFGLVTIPIHATADSSTATSSNSKNQIIVYESNFDSLKRGVTQPFPGAKGQDAWFRELAVLPGYGEIQNTIARKGQALHEFTSSSVPGFAQTIDKRFITPPDLSTFPVIKISIDFYAHTSDLNARNAFDAFISVTGGPHPGFDIFAVAVVSGNGTPKGESGVNITLSRFNGVNNNEPATLHAGQHLAWDAWHQIVLVIDQSQDRYVSLTVDGHTEDLSEYALPRSEVSAGVWERGQIMQQILANIAPHAEFDSVSDDDIYWDNLRITVYRSQ